MNLDQEEAAAEALYGEGTGPTSAPKALAEVSAYGESLYSQYNQRPADETTISEWTEASFQRLQETYGDEAGELLRAARDMIADDDQLRGVLVRTGLSSHPDVVIGLTRKAKRLSQRR